MNEREQAGVLALARIATGLGCLLAPRLATRVWTGEQMPSLTTRLALRGLGGRDLAIGVGILLAMENKGPARGWLEASALADASDALGTVMAWRQFPRLRAVTALGVEIAAAAWGMQLASAIDD